MTMFHETMYGRRFFDGQLPDLIKSLGRVADALQPKPTDPYANTPIAVMDDNRKGKNGPARQDYQLKRDEQMASLLYRMWNQMHAEEVAGNFSYELLLQVAEFLGIKDCLEEENQK